MKHKYAVTKKEGVKVELESMEMKEFLRSSDILAKRLAGSKMYKEYQRSLAEINNNPDIKERLKAFRSEYFEMQLAEQNGSQASLNDIKRIGSDYARLLSNKEVEKFLNSEKVITETIRRMCENIASACDLELESYLQ